MYLRRQALFVANLPDILQLYVNTVSHEGITLIVIAIINRDVSIALIC